MIDYGGLSACLLGFGFLCWNLSRLITWKQEGKGEEDDIFLKTASMRNYACRRPVKNFIKLNPSRRFLVNISTAQDFFQISNFRLCRIFSKHF